MSYWRGKHAVVTGGSSGLGLALAEELVAAEARVAIVARRAKQLEAAAEQLRNRGGDVLPISADLTQAQDVNRLTSMVQNCWGTLDLFCHCAGRSMRGTALATSPELFQELWEINFLSALRCTQQFAPLLTNARGHVVLVGSLASKVASGYLGAYPASKFALAALAQQLRLEAREAFHVLLVCPGPLARENAHAEGRYAAETKEAVPAAAHRPGGGAKLRAIDPHWLARKILTACQQRRAELVVPKTARLLFAISQISPQLGDWVLRKSTV